MLALTLSALAAPPVVLTAWVDATRADLRAVDAARCEPVLQGIFDTLRPLTPADVDLVDAHTHSEALLDGLFAARGDLEGALVRIDAAGGLDEGCATAARRADLALRYLADHVYIATPDANPWRAVEGFTGPDDLRAGDLLVTRGDKLSSAGIAHMGQIDTQFSHNALVHIDAAGDAWTVEAYLEQGALVQPLDTFLHHGLGRIAVLRFSDPEQMARGAALAYARVKDGAPIPYDEAFDSDDPSELFCSEIGPWALSLAGGPRDVPQHRTVFPHATNAGMFDAMGIRTPTLAAPADVLVDPRFTVVAEWRDVPLLPELWRQDAVVESLMTWMEQDGYALQPAWVHRATVDVGLAMRRTPGIGNLLAERLHPEGDRQFLVAGLALQQAGDALYADFDTRVPGYATWDEQKRALEALRAEDRALYETTPRKAGLHRTLR